LEAFYAFGAVWYGSGVCVYVRVANVAVQIGTLVVSIHFDLEDWVSWGLFWLEVWWDCIEWCIMENHIRVDDVWLNRMYTYIPWVEAEL
jgi:hypothetical protein